MVVAEIRRIEQADCWEKAANEFLTRLMVGDRITFELKNGKEAETVVVGKSHYEDGDIVLWFNRIVDERRMNMRDTNKGGWADCELREWLNKDFINQLPDDLRTMMVPKKTIQIINDKTIECEDMVSLPSHYEVAGEECYWAKYNGIDKHLPFFASERDCIVINDENETWFWWLADPSAANATAFCFFNLNGYSFSYYASYAGGVAPLIVLHPAEQ